MSHTTKTLGRLERVDLRDAWPGEASDFTPWLARAESLSLLGDTIGISLELEAQEQSVGPFRADILCKNVSNDQWVLIENQLEKTDHTHLGQVITYAAGLKADTIVWVAARFRDEHRAAIDWLNEYTDRHFNFFALEVELWRIGDSPVAPKFNIICEPNDWSRQVAQGASELDLSETDLLQLDFWTDFNNVLASRETSFNARKPRPQHWMGWNTGLKGVGVFAVARRRGLVKGSDNSDELGVDLVLNGEDAKMVFVHLEKLKPELQEVLGPDLVWENRDSVRTCRIRILKSVDLQNRDLWNSYHEWLLDNLERFRDAFTQRVRAILESTGRPSSAETD